MLDGIDRRLLSALAKDARASAHVLAGSLGVAPSTVIHRMRRLEKSGIIEGYSVRVNLEKAGYTLTALIEIIAKKGKIVDMEERLSKIPNVVGVYDITGTTDTIMVAKFTSRAEMDKFVKNLQAWDSVERTITHLALNVAKEEYHAPELLVQRK